MPEPKLPITGGCQCGQVKYQLDAPPLMTAVCHCMDCQRHSGGSYSISMVFSAESFQLLEGELGCWQKQCDSGAVADCYFCPVCSNRIYHTTNSTPGLLRLKGGTLDDTSWVSPAMHVWVKSKQPWVIIPKGVAVFDTQPESAEAAYAAVAKAKEEG